ncbi:MAG TPA: glutamate formimidoyltransferase [Mesotoga sp.]|jgi:glutamate formiminotransferase|nr:glutamate formimidoyltransferase [Mesotoga sp.]MDI9374270.1 glutamate formimidoyltransferase [Thermotogota bacterium]NLX33550.1 glutamate formimidoyltransferase [Thermotogaceae bacterium]MDD5743171.1 glutamate formimidoyltransferase [Mesotoga sp.]HOY26646.1 glutamate formimidoyltransferase [Mesotoga sp.]
MRLIESVPNFSEGRRAEVIEEIVNEGRKIDGVWILDYSSDPNHNRSVVTLTGVPEAIEEALFDMTKKARDLIDLKNHSGEHPRMGSADVIPLIPVMNTTKDECIELSRRLGRRIGEELSIPVYLYEDSATSPERVSLSNIRKGEFENFNSKITQEAWKPDFGPSSVHPSAGVVAVGCREYLIAFNVNLGTDNIEIANKIAKAIRHISGGFRYVKALGFRLEDRGIVQVSMNMTNYRKTPLFRVYEVIKSEAERYGVSIVGSEIVGLTPLQALVDVAEHYLKLEKFDSSSILEKRVLDFISREGE